MATWQYKDTCYPTELAAVEAFKGQWILDLAASPSATVPYGWSITTATANATGLVTYALKRSAGTTTLTGQTFQLQPCDSKSLNSVFDKMATNDLIFAAALIIIFVLGIGQGRGSR